jgi:hypothetical protein
MRERITRKDLDIRLGRIQEHGVDIDMHSANGGLRCTNKKGSVDISPRLSSREMYEWLDGYERGYLEGCHHARECCNTEVDKLITNFIIEFRATLERAKKRGAIEDGQHSDVEIARAILPIVTANFAYLPATHELTKELEKVI